MREIITFTEDELVQMLEGGEVMRDCQRTMNSVAMAISKGQHEIICKMEEK